MEEAWTSGPGWIPIQFRGNWQIEPKQSDPWRGLSSSLSVTEASHDRATKATPIQIPSHSVSVKKHNTCTICRVLDHGGSSRSDFGHIMASKTNGCCGCSLIIEVIMNMKPHWILSDRLIVRIHSENGYLYILIPNFPLKKFPIVLFCLEGT